MPGNFLDRLGELMRTPIRLPGQHHQEPAPEPAPDAAATTETPPAPEPPIEAVPANEAATAEQAPPAAETPAAEAPAEAPAAEAPAAPEPTEEERLWEDTHAAWSRGDFERVAANLSRLRVLEPEDKVEIDEKLASATYNWAAAMERHGDLQGALGLYRRALDHNPSLGQASAAVSRLETQLNPPAEAPPATGYPEAEATAEAAPEPRTYTVESGDSLSTIAEKVYGSQAEWPKIFEANRDILDNPDLIYPGQELKLP